MSTSERTPNAVSLQELDFDSQDLQACVAMMQGGSKTFFAASRLLPPRVRTAAIALYAFCRVADDLVDEAAAGDTPLDVLQERLDAIYAGTPHDHVEDHALSLVVQQYKLPRHLLDALIDLWIWVREHLLRTRLRVFITCGCSAFLLRCKTGHLCGLPKMGAIPSLLILTTSCGQDGTRQRVRRGFLNGCCRVMR